ncbi:hypothetical protein [Aequorivita echinoideorum]|uniref:Uncharacterized protein n=1 Tax=Aequorivita echinoideorum TaxID=1549647 RepID=A0ABS5S333_9FLAO|nr:hypothetical protein [Aequorivita echinoideorum]MBT0607621.1 hypothetical protein [Aequorivita echinoideorum]
MKSKNNKQIADSRKKAYLKIQKILDAGEVDKQFSHLSGEYYSSDKFIVTWMGFYRGIPSEFRISKCDSFYAAFSGYQAIYACASLFHEKQFEGFSTIERALISIGLKLAPPKQKRYFFDKYALPFNEKIKNIKTITNA